MLERFNGLTFVSLQPERVTDANGRDLTTPAIATGGGSSGGGGGYGPASPCPVTVTLSTTQYDLLEQSYAELTRSVYDALAPQTRLKGYLDAIDLAIDATGIKLDFAALEGMPGSVSRGRKAANDPKWMRAA